MKILIKLASRPKLGEMCQHSEVVQSFIIQFNLLFYGYGRRHPRHHYNSYLFIINIKI